jgi:hypothetical protein
MPMRLYLGESHRTTADSSEYRSLSHFAASENAQPFPAPKDTEKREETTFTSSGGDPAARQFDPEWAPRAPRNTACAHRRAPGGSREGIGHCDEGENDDGLEDRVRPSVRKRMAPDEL